jgi:hypothetical protein
MLLGLVAGNLKHDVGVTNNGLTDIPNVVKFFHDQKLKEGKQTDTFTHEIVIS